MTAKSITIRDDIGAAVAAISSPAVVTVYKGGWPAELQDATETSLPVAIVAAADHRRLREYHTGSTRMTEWALEVRVLMLDTGATAGDLDWAEEQAHAMEAAIAAAVLADPTRSGHAIDTKLMSSEYNPAGFPAYVESSVACIFEVHHRTQFADLETSTP